MKTDAKETVLTTAIFIENDVAKVSHYQRIDDAMELQDMSIVTITQNGLSCSCGKDACVHVALVRNARELDMQIRVENLKQREPISGANLLSNY